MEIENMDDKDAPESSGIIGWSGIDPRRIPAAAARPPWQPANRPVNPLEDWIGQSHGRIVGASLDGPALLFDGIDDYVQLPNFQNPASGNWTFMLLFQTSDATSNFSLLSQSGTVNTASWLHVLASRTLICSLPIPTDVPLGLQFATVSNNTWYLAILRRNGTNLYGSLRRTGSNQNSSVTAPNLQAVLDGNHYLGINATLESQFAFPGHAAYMAHYTRALADAELDQMFSGIKTIVAPRGISL
jgi:hypothetical protein